MSTKAECASCAAVNGWNIQGEQEHHQEPCGHQGVHCMQVVERVRRKAAVYGQDITSSSSAPGLEDGDSADGAGPAGCKPLSLHCSRMLPENADSAT